MLKKSQFAKLSRYMVANTIATDKTACTIHTSYSSISSHCSELSITKCLQYFLNGKGNFLRLIYGCFIAFIYTRYIYLLLHYTIIHTCTLYITCTCALIFKSKTNLAMIIVTLACNLHCSMNNSINCIYEDSVTDFC